MTQVSNQWTFASLSLVFSVFSILHLWKNNRFCTPTSTNINCIHPKPTARNRAWDAIHAGRCWKGSVGANSWTVCLTTALCTRFVSAYVCFLFWSWTWMELGMEFLCFFGVTVSSARRGLFLDPVELCLKYVQRHALVTRIDARPMCWTSPSCIQHDSPQ